MEKPNEKRPNQSQDSTRNPGTGTSNSGGSGSSAGMGAGAAGGTGSAGRTGGVSDNTRNPGSNAGTKGSTGSTGSTGGVSDNTRNTGTNTGIKGSTLNTGSTARSGSKRSTESEGEEKGILSSLGIKKNQLLTAIGAIAGGALLYKGAKAMKGPSAKTAGKAVVNIHSKLKVKRPKAELYSYWRNLENLPSFMSHIQEVEEIDNKKSH
jgi:hypothetical protein